MKGFNHLGKRTMGGTFIPHCSLFFFCSIFILGCGSKADWQPKINQLSDYSLSENNFVISIKPGNINVLNDSLFAIFPDHESIAIYNYKTGNLFKYFNFRSIIDVRNLDKTEYTLSHMKGDFLDPIKTSEEKKDPIFNFYARNLVVLDKNDLILSAWLLAPFSYEKTEGKKKTQIIMLNRESYLIHFDLFSNKYRFIPVNAINDSIGVTGNMMNGFCMIGDTLLMNCTFEKHKYEHAMYAYTIEPKLNQYHYCGRKTLFDSPENLKESAFTRFSNPTASNDTTYVKDFQGVYSVVTKKNILQKVFPKENNKEAINSFSFFNNSLLYTTALNKDTTAAIRKFSYYLNIYNIGDGRFIKFGIPSKRKLVATNIYQDKLICIETDEKQYFTSVYSITGL
jgi:hypothetical protein